MKKLIAIIAGLLFVVVLAAAALVLFDPFSGIEVKGNILEEEKDFEELYEDLEEFFKDDYSYEFEYKYEDLTIENRYRTEVQESSKGLVTSEYYKELDSFVLSFDVEGKATKKQVQATITGDKTYKDVYKEHVIKIGRDLEDEDSKDQYYVDAKVTEQKDRNKTISEYKTQESKFETFVPNLKHELLEYVDESATIIFEDDDEYTIIYDDVDEFVEVNFTFDGKDLEKVTIRIDYTDGFEEYSFKIVDFEEIKEPKDSSDYKPIPHKHEYNNGKCECGDFNRDLHYQHIYDSGVYCTLCGEECYHSYSYDGYCYYCNHYDSEHDYNDWD